MKLKFQTRIVYGRPLHYPMCDNSKHVVSKLARRSAIKEFNSSISDEHMELLKFLGHEIEQIPQFGVKT